MPAANVAPAPPSTTGPLTEVPAVNTAIGGSYLAGTNYVTSQATGAETFGLAMLLMLWFQWFKDLAWFDQQRHAVLALLFFGLLLSLSVAAIAIYLAHRDAGQSVMEAIPRAGAVAWQAQQDFLAIRATGLGGLKSAATVPSG